MNTKIMTNQVYFVLARVGADSIGLYVESPDFDFAYNVAEERIAQSYKGPFTKHSGFDALASALPFASQFGSPHHILEAIDCSSSPTAFA